VLSKKQEEPSMDVLKILGIIAATALVLAIYFAFDNRCMNKTGFSLLKDTTIFSFALAAWVIYIGLSWRSSLLHNGGDALNGTLIAACGASLLGFFVFKNFRQLGVAFGAIRTLLQVLLLPASMPLTLLYPLWALWKRMRAPVAVYVVRDD